MARRTTTIWRRESAAGEGADMAGATVPEPSDRARLMVATVVVAALVGGVVLRFVHLGAAKLDFDETFSAMAARLPVGKLFHFLRYHDSHPPLDYLTRKLVVDHSTSPWLFRLPSALMSVIGLGAFALWMRPFRRMGPIAVVLLAGGSFAVTYAHDGRMYAAMAAVGVLGAWAAFEWLRTRSRRAAAAVFVLLLAAVFLHSSGLFLALGLFLVPGLDRSRPAWWWRAAVALPVLAWVVLWGPAFRYQAGHKTASWIPYTRPQYLLRVLNE